MSQSTQTATAVKPEAWELDLRAAMRSDGYRVREQHNAVAYVRERGTIAGCPDVAIEDWNGLNDVLTRYFPELAQAACPWPDAMPDHEVDRRAGNVWEGDYMTTIGACG